MKKIRKILLCILCLIVLAVGGFALYLTVTEFKPAPVEELEVSTVSAGRSLQTGTSLEVLSWNIGYGGLGAASDFFMDGGTQVQAADEQTVRRYLDGIAAYIDSAAPDLVMLQEVDVNSSRTYSIDETQALAGDVSVHALNYSCDFVPYPWPPIGKVHCGLMTTTTGCAIDRAERIALPCPFSWPMSAANLKRCLLVSYLPIEGSDKQLVLVNLHLEAYDDGEGKRAQTEQLRAFIQSAYDAGNYVIAGGDFNQVFPGSLDIYPNRHPELWVPGVLEDSLLPDGWHLAYDNTSPSCRLLNQPYDPSDAEGTQYYVIDGFILSPNVQLEAVETVDLGFANSDHNPVKLRVTLD